MNQITFKKLININAPILITGETGTGKSKMARRIFDLASIHRDKFLTIHLASLKEDLLESELFGHRKGAFTGAVENKSGYLSEAGKGTLFLDEIGELSLESQKKLLYLLEEKKFTPVGAVHPVSFEGRLIMATNKNLKQMVRERKFREDLYFRLNIFHLELKSISADKEKLEREIQKNFEAMKSRYHRPALKINSQLMQILLTASWKGNYRELRNCLEFMVALSESAELTRESLPEWFFHESPETEFVSHFPSSYNQALEEFETKYLRTMLSKNQGRVNETSRELGISKTTLIAKARKYGIDTLMLRAEANKQKYPEFAA